MSKLLSSRFSNGAVHLSQLVLRLGFGGLIMTHGWSKLMGWSEMSHQFFAPFGMSPTVALALTIFAELFCGALVVLGLVTRWATIPILITMAVALFMVHAHDPLGKKEMAILYAVAFVAILITGPGKYSLDGAIGK